MEEHVVHLLRIQGTTDEECEEFLKCLYDRIERDAPERRELDQEGLRTSELAQPGDLQPVPITGDFGIEGAHAQVDELATACRPDWETLYQIIR